ncbi:MAG: hypothetical protein M1281_20170 [Chloroflexi bacterium]|nr:hypothetical protein [Chloroflexota bacterium]
MKAEQTTQWITDAIPFSGFILAFLPERTDDGHTVYYDASANPTLEG